MARAERNRPLTGVRGPLVILEWTWFQWVTGIVSTLAPAVALVAWLDQHSDYGVASVPNMFIALFVLANVYVFYSAMQSFDGAGTWSLRWAAGSYMKMLAVLHAVGAMYMIVVTRKDVVLFSDSEPIPEGVIWIAFGVFWAIAGVSYMVGDAHIRIGARQAEDAIISVQKMLKAEEPVRPAE